MLVQSLIGLGLTVFGAVAKTYLDHWMQAKRGARIIILERIDRILGDFSQYGAPTPGLRSDSRKAKYFALTARNLSKGETASGCLPELFLITTKEKIHALAFWLPAQSFNENDVEEYTTVIYRGGEESLVCLAAVSHSLFFYDPDKMLWTKFEGPGDLRFKLAAAVRADNCKTCIGREFDLLFKAESETIEVHRSRPINLAKENFSRYIATL